MSKEKIEELQKLIQKEEAKLQQEATVEVGGSDNFKAEEQATDRTSRQPNLYRVGLPKDYYHYMCQVSTV